MPGSVPTRSAEDDHSAAGLWLVMLKSYRSMQMFVESTLTGHHICLSDFVILEALLHKGEMSMSMLGATVVLAKPSMTAAIARLAKLRYVKRGCEKGDRRVHSIALTAEGRSLIETIFVQHEHDLESVMAGVSPEQRDRTRTVLKSIGLAARARVESTSPVVERAGCADTGCGSSGCASSD